MALAWSLGRCIETPIPISPPSTLCLQAANPARLASTHPNICSTSTNSNASCIPSLAVWPPSSEKVSRTIKPSDERASLTRLASQTAPTSPALTGSDLRPPRMPRARRAAAGSPLLRQALHAAEPLRGLAPHNIRHRYAAWERARGRAPAWVLAHGPSSASSSDEDEDDAFEQSMGHSWDGILDAYEDEQMAGWDHWSGRKLQPDQLDDEWC